MKRRSFIKTASAATLPFILQSCNWEKESPSFAVTVHSDYKSGHLTQESSGFTTGKDLRTDVLIVGGGIAGLTAAWQLKDRDILVLELSDRAGGSSSAGEEAGTVFSMGAHYDLSYPSTYGENVLSMLEAMNIIKYQPWKDHWTFADSQYIVPHKRKNRCFDHGEYRDDVLPEGPEKEQFEKIIWRYNEKMQLPTRLTDNEHKLLNNVSFLDFLLKEMPLTDHFVRCLDYNMRDDYGGTASQVSALAGIHYFICRPYYTQVVDLFSPPEGNNYFVNKLIDDLPNGTVKINSVVKRLSVEKDGVTAEVLDVTRRENYRIKANKVVYAGQKHALKYVFPQDSHLFKNNRYAPWMIVNIVIKNDLEDIGYWQNEIITDDPSFLGFVDSNMQHKGKQPNRVLTAYYCLPEASRNDLVNTEQNKAVIAENTIRHIEEYFGTKIRHLTRAVHIKPMGHAMPLPVPGYLFRDANEGRSDENIVYAGVDNGRLPLLFEAMDSGIAAAGLV